MREKLRYETKQLTILKYSKKGAWRVKRKKKNMAMECRGSRNHSREYMLLQVWQGTRNMENYEDMQKDATPMRIEA